MIDRLYHDARHALGIAGWCMISLSLLLAFVGHQPGIMAAGIMLAAVILLVFFPACIISNLVLVRRGQARLDWFIIAVFVLCLLVIIL